MRVKLGKGYTPSSRILGNWVWKSDLGECPKCSLPLIRIIETGVSVAYYHSEKILCVVLK